MKKRHSLEFIWIRYKCDDLQEDDEQTEIVEEDEAEELEDEEDDVYEEDYFNFGDDFDDFGDDKESSSFKTSAASTLTNSCFDFLNSWKLETSVFTFLKHFNIFCTIQKIPNPMIVPKMKAKMTMFVISGQEISSDFVVDVVVMDWMVEGGPQTS
ncbi:unnamed protein product [Caenorhabditis nigoni]